LLCSNWPFLQFRSLQCSYILESKHAQNQKPNKILALAICAHWHCCMLCDELFLYKFWILLLIGLTTHWNISYRCCPIILVILYTFCYGSIHFVQILPLQYMIIMKEQAVLRTHKRPFFENSKVVIMCTCLLNRYIPIFMVLIIRKSWSWLERSL
jgi:hypothetical protein